MRVETTKNLALSIPLCAHYHEVLHLIRPTEPEQEQAKLASLWYNYRNHNSNNNLPLAVRTTVLSAESPYRVDDI